MLVVSSSSVKSWQAFAVLVMIIVLSAWPIMPPSAGMSLAIAPVFPISPIVKDHDGTVQTQIRPGSQVSIEAGASDPSTDLVNPVYIVIAIRDKDGTTLHFTWQSVYLQRGDKATVGMSWSVPADARPHDEYVIRCFVIQSVAADHMQALSDVYETHLRVS